MREPMRGIPWLGLLILAFSGPVSALTDEEILRRFEAYEQRIQALEAELKTLRAEKQPAESPAPQAESAPASQEALGRLERQVQSIGEELQEGRERLRIDGYASAGVAYSDSDEPFQTSGNQIHKDFDFNADTVLGLQATFMVNEQTDFVTQFVARGVDEGRTSDEFDLEVEWAYFDFRLDSHSRVRAGRSRLPLFMLSEYLEVGYAHPWVRPPVEVYALLGDFTNYDGLNLRHTRFLPGQWFLSTQAYWGGRATDTSLAGSPINVDFDDILGINATLQHDDLTLFASVARADLSISPLPATIAPLEAILNAAGQSLAVDKEDTGFAGTGFRYNDGTWMLMGEATRVFIDGWLSDWDSYYLTGGRQLGDFLLHLTFAQINTTDHENRVFPALPPAFRDFREPPFLIDAEQSSWTLGVRYDLSPGIALKGEVQHVFDFNGTAGLFGARPEESVNVWSFVLDAMF